MLSNLSTSPHWRLEHTYAELPASFHEQVEPSPVREPGGVVFNRALAELLGLDAEALAEAHAIFAGNELPPGARPIAQAYAGHQFGHFTNLGDGRAILLGEQITPGGERFDIQLKGPGPTPFSRRGDGRAALGPMLREYIISEAMSALGIPTTRSLAVVTTGEKVWRQDGGLPGAVLTRVAASHIRVGTFELAAARRDVEGLRALADYTMRRHYPETEGSFLAFYEAVMEQQAALIAKWMHVGFIHGVMNTDNMALSGETIDYGPCAFMDTYDPATVFSSIDRNGRYAYGNQPHIAQWNLARLAEALLPLLHEDEKKALELANGAIASFPARFERHSLTGMRAKLGLFNEEADDAALVEDVLSWMKAERADFTNTFRALSVGDLPDAEWLPRWQSRLARQPQSPSEVAEKMRAYNPAVIPRNHKVEEALAAATEGDLNPLHRLLAALKCPYEDALDSSPYKEPPPEGGGPYQTFCGT